MKNFRHISCIENKITTQLRKQITYITEISCMVFPIASCIPFLDNHLRILIDVLKFYVNHYILNTFFATHSTCSRDMYRHIHPVFWKYFHIHLFSLLYGIMCLSYLC